MTNFSGIGRQGIWSWLTPERAVLVVPVFAGLGLSMALLSVGITPLTIRVREQSEVVEQLTTKAEFVPVLRQQLAAVKRDQLERDQQLDRCWNWSRERRNFKRSWRDSMIWPVSTTLPSPPRSLGLLNGFRRPCLLRVRTLHPQPGVEDLKQRAVIHC